MRVAAVTAAVAGVVTIALAFGRTSADSAPSASIDGQPEQFAHVVVLNPVHPLTPSATANQLLQEIRNRLPGMLGSIITLDPLPPAADGSLARMRLTVRIPIASMSDPTFLKLVWQAYLLGGGLNDALRSEGYAGLESVNIELLLPSGRLIDYGGGFGNVVTGQQFTLQPDSLLESRIDAGLRDAGLTPVSIAFIRPVQAAPIVTARAADPSAWVRSSYETQTWRKIFGDPNDLEGLYLEVVDSTGAPIYIQGESGRVGTGLQWIAPGLRLDRTPNGGVGEPGW